MRSKSPITLFRGELLPNLIPLLTLLPSITSVITDNFLSVDVSNSLTITDDDTLLPKLENLRICVDTEKAETADDPDTMALLAMLKSRSGSDSNCLKQLYIEWTRDSNCRFSRWLCEECEVDDIRFWVPPPE
jgi:hypothetical protein